MTKVQAESFRFEGFENPTTTPTPDVVFDELLSVLSGAELKVLLYIIRRTFGFKKSSDTISLSQITSGIVTRNGRVLDKGTGLDRSSAIKATKGLVDKGIITVWKEKGEDGVNQINVYGLRFRALPTSYAGVVEKTHYGSGKILLPVVGKNHPQETVGQETVQQDFNLSKFEEANIFEEHGDSTEKTNGRNSYKGERLRPFAKSESIDHEMDQLTKLVLHDVSHLKANTTQALNLWQSSKLSEKEFIALMRETRRITEDHVGKIKKKANHYFGMKNSAPYFFQVLRNLVVQYRRDKMMETIRTRG